LAADSAVVEAASNGFRAAKKILEEARIRGFRDAGLPLLMVSLNDGNDPHFRKAEFDPDYCPHDCFRPCEAICPAQAITLEVKSDRLSGGVDEHRCYGCGRCLPVCPLQQIQTRSYVVSSAALLKLVLDGIDAIEIHTQVGRLEQFKRLWTAIAPFAKRLQVLAISCPNGDGLIEYLWSLYDLISPLPCELIWQTDGRPMSGDIGNGTTHAAIRLGQTVLDSGPPGYVQLAGGTNRHTVIKLRKLGLLPPHSSSQGRYVAGVAYGSYARNLLSPILNQLEENSTNRLISVMSDGVSSAGIASSNSSLILQSSIKQTVSLEANPDLLWQAVAQAHSLVSQLKSPMKI
jgi:Fe-S-cluster-containing hydrogenase component 2